MKHRVLKSLAIILGISALAMAQDLASFEKRITLKKLDNGLTVIICERPEAPVFSFYTHVNAGSVQDPMGQTGMAHMFEHMAFKGTDKIGTTDYAAEKVALRRWKPPTPPTSRSAISAWAAMSRRSKICKRHGRTISRPHKNTSSPTSSRRFSKAMAPRV